MKIFVIATLITVRVTTPIGNISVIRVTMPPSGNIAFFLNFTGSSIGLHSKFEKIGDTQSGNTENCPDILDA